MNNSYYRNKYSDVKLLMYYNNQFHTNTFVAISISLVMIASIIISFSFCAESIRPRCLYNYIHEWCVPILIALRLWLQLGLCDNIWEHFLIWTLRFICIHSIPTNLTKHKQIILMYIDDWIIQIYSVANLCNGRHWFVQHSAWYSMCCTMCALSIVKYTRWPSIIIKLIRKIDVIDEINTGFSPGALSILCGCFFFLDICHLWQCSNNALKLLKTVYERSCLNIANFLVGITDPSQQGVRNSRKPVQYSIQTPVRSRKRHLAEKYQFWEI